MFTTVAILLAMFIAWFAQKKNEKDRQTYDREASDDRIWLLMLHTRQDMKLVAFLLFGIIIMLGVVADLLVRG